MSVGFNWSIWFICKDPYNNFLFPKTKNKTKAAQLLSRQLWSLFILF